MVVVLNFRDLSCSRYRSLNNLFGGNKNKVPRHLVLLQQSNIASMLEAVFETFSSSSYCQKSTEPRRPISTQGWNCLFVISITTWPWKMIFIIWGERFFFPSSSLSSHFLYLALISRTCRLLKCPLFVLFLSFSLALLVCSLFLMLMDERVPRCLSGQSHVAFRLGSVCSQWHEACDRRFQFASVVVACGAEWSGRSQWRRV